MVHEVNVSQHDSDSPHANSSLIVKLMALKLILI